MKATKIKNMKNKRAIFKMLIQDLSENGFYETNWIYPTYDSYIIVDNDKIISCYITIKEDEAISLWVSPLNRKHGYARFLVSLFNIKYASAYPSSLLFWKSLGFKEISAFKMKKY